MNINYQNVGITITDSIKTTIGKKAEKLNRYSDNMELKVVIKKKKIDFKVEFTVDSKFNTIRVEKSDPDVYVAIDKAMHTLERKLRKYKNQMVNRWHDKSVDFTELEPVDGLSVVREKNISIKSMDVTDAIIQMDMSDHDFYVFSRGNDVRIVYKRKDGDCGLLNIG